MFHSKPVCKSIGRYILVFAGGLILALKIAVANATTVYLDISIADADGDGLLEVGEELTFNGSTTQMGISELCGTPTDPYHSGYFEIYFGGVEYSFYDTQYLYDCTTGELLVTVGPWVPPNAGNGQLNSGWISGDPAIVTVSYSSTGSWYHPFTVVEPQDDLAVSFDVKPAACPNVVNLKSRGFLPVAILGSYEFDVTQIDVATVRVVGTQPVRSGVDDVATPHIPLTEVLDADDCSLYEGDGYVDLTLKFDNQAVIAAIENGLGRVLEDGEVLTLEVTGELFDGRPFAGEDVVVIKKRGR